MLELAEPNQLSSGFLLLMAAALLALPRTPWLRLHDVARPASSLSPAPILARTTPIAVLTAVGTLTLLCAISLLPGALDPPDPWSALVRLETALCIGLILLIGLLDADVPRVWLLLAAAVSAGAAWAGAAWLQACEVDVLLGTSGAPFCAAVLTVLLLSPGPAARLVSQVRKSAVEAAGDHVLLVDPAGDLLHASDDARAALGLDRPPGSRGPLPDALREFLEDPKRTRARLRAPSGRILEARLVDLGQHAGLRRIRAILVRDVTGAHRDERRLLRLAHYDSLTGLANRRLFLETLKKSLEAAADASRRSALFYLDLDDFKAINDTLGHAAGDALLRAVADRFRAHLRPEQVARFGIGGDARLVIARLAGDEFAVIAPDIPDSAAASELARFLIEVIRRPLELTDRTLAPSASVGVALFPDHGADVETLLRHADSALYVAKSRGRRRFAWYEPAFDAKADRARRVEEGLRTALERGEMRLHYQPKVDARSGELVGFEALLRWRSAALGDVGPVEFIPVAEARGHITAIGSWCLDEACRQLCSWREAGLAIVPVSVNVSSAQFAESDLQREVSGALQRHGIEPRYLELELTESLLLEERFHVEQVLRDLRTIGVRIALDDFGTGYSALTYLNRFSLDVLKMDRGLLRDIDSNPAAHGIAKAVVSMAHSLGLSVVAEGIDTEEQVPMLRDMACDHIQGFLYAPALPAEDALGLMCRLGDPPKSFGPGMAIPGARRPELELGDEPCPKDESSTAIPVTRERDTGRVLLVDDGQGTLGNLALRLGHLGIDIHYASEVDEAKLFVAQEREAIRMIACPPTLEPASGRGVVDSLTQTIGEQRCFVVIGERPDDRVRLGLREAGVDWVLWEPFNDVELRYVIKSAMTLREDLIERREIRVPVDLVANIWSGDRREVAVVSSLSARGAFIELSEPLRKNSSLRIEMDLGGARYRGFARVIHVQAENPERPREPSGIGVAFYGSDRDEERLLRKAIGELESRYLP